MMKENEYEINEPGDPDDGNFGERTYSGEELKSMTGSNSLLGYDRLDTGTLHWSVTEDFCMVEIREFLQYETNEPFKGVELKDGLVDMEVSGQSDTKDYILKIPLKQISQMKVSSELYEYYGEYSGPGTYTFTIDFVDEGELSIRGDFKLYTPEGKFLPKAGYYHHRAAYKTGS